MPQDTRPQYDGLYRPFSRPEHSDWMQSLKRVARAQAILWHETPISERQKLLARVDQEQETPT